MGKRINSTAIIAFTAIMGASSMTGFSSSVAVKSDAGQLSQISAPVYFRQGNSKIDRNFMDNRSRIDSFVNNLRKILSDTTCRITEIRVTGLASVEGGLKRNNQLAGERAEALARLVAKESGIDRSLIHVVNGGENWEGLLAMTLESDDIPDKEAAVEVLSWEGASRDSIKNALMTLKGGKAWKYMYEHFFPVLRTGAGGAGRERRISSLGKDNFRRLGDALTKLGADSAIVEKVNRQDATSADDYETVDKTIEMLKNNTAPEEFAEISHKAVDGMLQQSDESSKVNWDLLREYISGSDIEYKDSVLNIIDSVPAAAGRERMLRALNGGMVYKEIEKLYPQLLNPGVDSSAALAEIAAKENSLKTKISMLQDMIRGVKVPESRKVVESLDSAKTISEQQRVINSMREDPNYVDILEKAEIPDDSEFTEAAAKESDLKARVSMLKYLIGGSGIPGCEAVVASLDSVAGISDVKDIINNLRGDTRYNEFIEIADIPDVPTLAEASSQEVMLKYKVSLLRYMLTGCGIPGADDIAQTIEKSATTEERQEVVETLKKEPVYGVIMQIAEIPDPIPQDADETQKKELDSKFSMLQYMLTGAKIPGSDNVAASLDNVTDLAGQQKIVNALREDPRYDEFLVSADLPDDSVFAEAVAREREMKSKISLLQNLLVGAGIEGGDKVAESLDTVTTISGQREIIDNLRGDSRYTPLMEIAGVPESSAFEYAARKEAELNSRIAVLRQMLTGSEIPGCEAVLASLEGAASLEAQQEIIDNLREDSRYTALLEKAEIPDKETFAEIVEVVRNPSLALQDIGSPVTEGRMALVTDNWRRIRDMISEDEIPEDEKMKLLEIIDGTSGSSERLEKLLEACSPEVREKFSVDYFPELLYGLSPTAIQNWAIVEKAVKDSDMDNKEEIMKIMQTLPAGEERVQALVNLDGGRIWDEVREQAFAPLLLDYELATASSESGMTATFEQAPLLARTDVDGKTEQTAVDGPADAVGKEEDGVEVDKDLQNEADNTIIPTFNTNEERKDRSGISVDILTDVVRDAGLQPGFKLGSPLPNIAVGVNVLRQWSVQVSAAYSNWNAFGGGNKLFAMTDYGVEARYWLDKEGSFSGFYAGVYGAVGDFDVQKKDLTTGQTGTWWNAGASGGYLLKLGETGWIFDFGLRLGYRSAQCDDYTIGHGYYEGHYYLDQKVTRGAFTPSVKIGIGYRFGK